MDLTLERDHTDETLKMGIFFTQISTQNYLTTLHQENIKSSGMATCLCKCPRETAIALEGELFEGCTVVSIYKSRAVRR